MKPMIPSKISGALTLIAGIGTSHVAQSAEIKKAPKPNILIITSHDLGQHLNCYGVPTVNSPNIDRLASKGIMFRDFYSTSAVSSPGRASLFTGRYPQSNGMMGLTHGPWWWSLNPGEKHMAGLLKNEGYKTTLIGFTHVGEPKQLGFDNHLSQKLIASETVSETIRFFEQQTTDKPFFVKAGFTEVHDPYKHQPDSTKGIYIPEYLQNTQAIRAELGKFQGDIMYLDSCIGKIVEAVEKSKVGKNTIIVFTSDHGIGFPGAKWTTRKAGLEVPFIVYLPNSIFSGGKIFSGPMSNVDVLPTLFDYCGFPIPDNIEGVSFRKLIAGETDLPPRNCVFGQFTPDMKRDNQSRTIITGKYQLIRYFDAGRSVVYPTDTDPEKFAAHTGREKTSGVRPFFELYDTENDPFELNNLGAEKEYDHIVKELSTKLFEWMKAVDDPLLKGPLSTPYYEKSMDNFRDLL